MHVIYVFDHTVFPNENIDYPSSQTPELYIHVFVLLAHKSFVELEDDPERERVGMNPLQFIIPPEAMEIFDLENILAIDKIRLYKPTNLEIYLLQSKFQVSK